MEVYGFGTREPSQNRKIISRKKNGPTVFATYREIGVTCPSTCAFLPKKSGGKYEGGCYYGNGYMKALSNRAGSVRFDPVAWVKSLPKGSFIRWNVGGDLLGEDGQDYRDAIILAHLERPDTKGWTYTHAWYEPEIVAWMQMLPSNITCAASCDTKEQIEGAKALGWKVQTIGYNAGAEHFTDTTAREARRLTGGLPCPAQRVEMGCADCMACSRKGLVLFAFHGPERNNARKSLEVIQ